MRDRAAVPADWAGRLEAAAVVDDAGAAAECLRHIDPTEHGLALWWAVQMGAVGVLREFLLAGGPVLAGDGIGVDLATAAGHAVRLLLIAAESTAPLAARVLRPGAAQENLESVAFAAGQPGPVLAAHWNEPRLLALLLRAEWSVPAFPRGVPTVHGRDVSRILAARAAPWSPMVHYVRTRAFGRCAAAVLWCCRALGIPRAASDEILCALDALTVFVPGIDGLPHAADPAYFAA